MEVSQSLPSHTACLKTLTFALMAFQFLNVLRASPNTSRFSGTVPACLEVTLLDSSALTSTHSANMKAYKSPEGDTVCCAQLFSIY